MIRSGVRLEGGPALASLVDMVTVGAAKAEELKVIAQSHAVVGVALHTDEGVAVARAVANQVLHKLKVCKAFTSKYIVCVYNYTT